MLTACVNHCRLRKSLLKSLATEYRKTVIMVSHDPKMVDVFPIVYGMRDGRFVTTA